LYDGLKRCGKKRRADIKKLKIKVKQIKNKIT
jgi:hypothetical protein